MDAPSPLHQLLQCPESPALTDWYADPVPADALAGWQRRLRRELGDAYRRGHPPHPALRLAELLLTAAADRDTGGILAALQTDCQGPWAALRELIQGQLLLARHLSGAWTPLQRGTILARPYWQGSDYFVVLRRHTHLQPLVLGPTPRPVQPLRALLAEAAAIARLRGLRPHQLPRGTHLDTLG